MLDLIQAHLVRQLRELTEAWLKLPDDQREQVLRDITDKAKHYWPRTSRTGVSSRSAESRQ